MQKTVVLIVDATISVKNVEAAVKAGGFLALTNDRKITVWRNPANEDSPSIEIVCNNNDFYSYDDAELICIRRVISNPQMIYVWFRDKGLMTEVCDLLLSKFDMIFDDDEGSLTYKGTLLEKVEGPAST
jgi:hypothetical protein